MAEVPQPRRSFKVTTKHPLHGIETYVSNEVTRVVCEFPDKIWVQTGSDLYKIEILQNNNRFTRTLLRWIPFLK